jgi:hypothetical protein
MKLDARKKRRKEKGEVKIPKNAKDQKKNWKI